MGMAILIRLYFGRELIPILAVWQGSVERLHLPKRALQRVARGAAPNFARILNRINLIRIGDWHTMVYWGGHGRLKPLLICREASQCEPDEQTTRALARAGFIWSFR